MGDQSETSTSGAATKMRKLSLEDQGTGSMSRSQQHEGRQHLNTLSQLFEADQNDHRGRMLKKLHDLGFPPALIHLVPRYWSRGHSERYNDVKEKRSSVAVHVAVAQENEWFRTMLASGLSEAQALQEGKPVYVELDTNFLILEAFAKYLYVGNVRTVVEPARTLVGGLAGLFGLARQVLDTNLAQAALDAYAEHIDRKPMLSQLADPLVVQHRELAFVALRAAFMDRHSRTSFGGLAEQVVSARSTDGPAARSAIWKPVEDFLETAWSAIDDKDSPQGLVLQAMLKMSLTCLLHDSPSSVLNRCSAADGLHTWVRSGNNHSYGSSSSLTCEKCRSSIDAREHAPQSLSVDLLNCLCETIKPSSEFRLTSAPTAHSSSQPRPVIRYVIKTV